MLNAVIIFLVVILAGLSVVFIPKTQNQNFRYVVSFSGAYLFSLTVIHILPELFVDAPDAMMAGSLVLGGFFFQMILEYFSTGVEHGHMHLHHHDDHGHAHAMIPWALFLSMLVHSFLDGTLLAHPSEHHAQGDTTQLLLGLILHKVPEAIALMSVLVYSDISKMKCYILFFIFAVASPLGMALSFYFYQHIAADSPFYNLLFALVAGSFLYISTTILFETSPQHTFKAKRLIVTLVGAGMAIIAQMLIH